MEISRILRVVSTNWIHIVGFYFSTYLYLVLYDAFGSQKLEDVPDPMLIYGLPVAFSILMLYGLIAICIFYLAIVCMDLVGFYWTRGENFTKILIIEWIAASVPLVYWSVKSNQWFVLILSASVLGTQFIRRNKIKQILTLNGGPVPN